MAPDWKQTVRMWVITRQNFVLHSIWRLCLPHTYKQISSEKDFLFPCQQQLWNHTFWIEGDESDVLTILATARLAAIGDRVTGLRAALLIFLTLLRGRHLHHDSVLSSSVDCTKKEQEGPFQLLWFQQCTYLHMHVHLFTVYIWLNHK